MPIYRSLPGALTAVDVIVVGGGTAGCVVASRLADTDRALSILVIESGSSNLDLPIITNPALYRANYAPGCDSSVRYTSTDETQILERNIEISVGHCLGGGSAVNGLIYARPQAADFDSWQTKGWSAAELIPCLKKFETFHSPNAHESHGSNGPIHVSRGTFQESKLEKDFIDAMKDLGYPEVQDLQNLHIGNGASRASRYVSPDKGQRQDSAHRYLYPRMEQQDYPNLHVLVEAQVTRVLINENLKVEGVEYRSHPKSADPSRAESVSTQMVEARKFVILSAGAFGSPLLLERSGVGDQKILGDAGVPVRHHLPGVGRHFQDHQCCLFTYESMAPPSDTFESIYNGTRSIPQLLAGGDAILSWNGVDASAKIRPTDSEIKSMGTNLQKAWDEDYKSIPTKPLAGMILISGVLTNPAAFPQDKQYFTICSYTPYPYSEGSMHIKGPQIDQSPDFRTGYLTDRDDVDIEIQVWAYKRQREIARRMPSFRNEMPNQHPDFPEGSSAACITDNDTRAPVNTEIAYSEHDDDVIRKFIRGKVGTTWHPIGTCRMAPVGDTGVVDERLNVHGLKGLKIADLSILPRNVASNTTSAAYLVGERAAEIFEEDLKFEALSS